MEQMVANGLNKQPVATIAALIVELGFNCVRLPYSLDVVLGKFTKVPDAQITLAANRDMWSLSPMGVFNATVTALTNVGLMVILNNHVSSNGWCCTMGDGEGLWYTQQYPTEKWLDSVGDMASRYRDNPFVVGFDLRNELRPSYLGSPTWGTGDNYTDWSLAAYQGAMKVVDANDGMLVIVSGLWFSIFLCDVPSNPIHMQEPLRNRTLYTAHEYKWVNFHIVAGTAVGAYVTALVAWCGLTWLILAVGSWLESRQAHGTARLLKCILRCGMREVRPPCCRRICKTRGQCELLAGVLLTSASVVGLMFTSHFINYCSAWGLAVSLASGVLSVMCGGVSFMLWMRLVLAAVQQLHLRGCHMWSEARHTGISLEIAAMQGACEPTVFAVSPRRCERDRQDTSQVSSTLDPNSIPGATTRATQDKVFPLLRADSREVSSTGLTDVELSAVPDATPSTMASFPLIDPLRSSRCLVAMVVLVIMAGLVCMATSYTQYEAFKGELDGRWGFLLDSDAQAAPVWVGEFGAESNSSWWRHTLRYIKERDVSWAYWSLNGEKRVNESETFGILFEDSLTVRHPWKLSDLQDLMKPQPSVASVA